MSLYEKVVNKYGVDISYKGFMNLVSNRSTWKLLYAVAITDILDVTIDELFDIVEIDIKSKIREKERWKEKYEKRR